jgi:hypothetical protein
MNPKSKLLGTANELLMAIGAALITFGVNATQSHIETGAGLILAILSLVLTFQRHEGADLIKSGVRKVLSAAGGAAVAFGLVTPDKVEALMAVVGPILAIAWSVNDKGAKVPKGLPLILITALVVFILPACSSTSLVFTPDGCILNRYTTDNGQEYKAGFCVDAEGKVNRAAVEWTNQTGQEFRLTVYKSKRYLLQYRPAPNAPWISYSEKSGILIGPFPAQVAPVINGEDVEPDTLVPAAKALPVAG